MGSGSGGVKGKYSCMECRAKDLVASKFLLNITVVQEELVVDPSWCGVLWGWCQDCALVPNFRAAVRNAWDQYRELLGNKVVRVRDLRHRGQMALLDEAAGDTMSNTQKKQLARSRVVVLVAFRSDLRLGYSLGPSAILRVTARCMIRDRLICNRSSLVYKPR